MKRRDVVTQILYEVSGRPKAFVEDIMNIFLLTIPGQHKFDDDISIEEYEQLLNEMRKEKEGIQQLLIKGSLNFILRHGKPEGNV